MSVNTGLIISYLSTNDRCRFQYRLLHYNNVYDVIIIRTNLSMPYTYVIDLLIRYKETIEACPPCRIFTVSVTGGDRSVSVIIEDIVEAFIFNNKVSM